jgi:hypothetical protein
LALGVLSVEDSGAFADRNHSGVALGLQVSKWTRGYNC